MSTQFRSGRKYKVLLAALLLGAMASESVLAQHRGHHRHGHGHGARIGVYIGAPIIAYGAYRSFHRPHYSPFYYPPVAVLQQVVPQAPPVYIEQPQVIQPPVQPPQVFQPQAEPVPQSSSNALWYFCPDSKTYYPYVRQCPSAWQPVTPHPQG